MRENPDGVRFAAAVDVSTSSRGFGLALVSPASKASRIRSVTTATSSGGTSASRSTRTLSSLPVHP